MGQGRPGDAGVEERALACGSGLGLNSNNRSHVNLHISFIVVQATLLYP